MLPVIKDKFWYLYGTFHDSEVILWSRLQIAIGSGWFAMQGVDVSPILTNPKHLMGYLIFSNFVNEMLRRRNADYNKDGSIK